MTWTEQPSASASWGEEEPPISDTYVITGYWIPGYVVNELWTDKTNEADTWQSL